MQSRSRYDSVGKSLKGRQMIGVLDRAFQNKAVALRKSSLLDSIAKAKNSFKSGM